MFTLRLLMIRALTSIRKNKVGYSAKKRIHRNSSFYMSLEENDEEKVFQMYSREEIENFRMIFEMFDPNKTGFVMVKDLETILKSLGRDPSEANELVTDMQNEQNDQVDERLSFMEFLKIMKALENRLTDN